MRRNNELVNHTYDTPRCHTLFSYVCLNIFASRKWTRVGNPFKDRNIPNTDEFKTIFVGRLNYNTTEERLKKEFDLFGTVDHVRLVRDQKGKSRGYAFVTFSREREADNAIYRAQDRRIDNRRILVDRELGRTKRSWLPRRLGGGKGGEKRRSEADKIVQEVQNELRRERREQEEKLMEARKSTDPQPKVEQITTQSAANADPNDEREPGEI